MSFLDNIDFSIFYVAKFDPEIAKAMGGYFPWVGDFVYAALFAALMTFVHYFLVHKFFLHLSRLAMPKTVGRYKEIPFCDPKLLKYYTKTSDKRKNAKWLSRVSGVPEDDVDAWLVEMEHYETAKNAAQKFAASGFRFIHYVLSVSWGTYVLWDKTWFSNVELCLEDYPHHPIESDVFWFYMYSISFYMHATTYHFIEPKKSDFWWMLVHHLSSLTLLTFSYWANFIRIGSVILFVHDLPDLFLELAKMLNYSEGRMAEILSNVVFTTFALVFWFSRLYILPFYVLRVAMISPFKYGWEWTFPYFFFNGLLFILLLISIYWSYLILKIVLEVVVSGDLNDTREKEDQKKMKKMSMSKKKKKKV